MSFLQFVWSKKWFDLNSSAAVVATASVSAATVKMMNSPNLCITVLSLKCNYEDSRSFCHQIKSHIGWKDEVKTKQVITFSRPQTNWGGLQTTQDPPTSVGLRARESDNLLRFDIVFSANMSFDLVTKTSTIFIIAFQRKYHDAEIGRFHRFDCGSTCSCCDHNCRRGIKVSPFFRPDILQKWHIWEKIWLCNFDYFY